MPPQPLSLIRRTNSSAARFDTDSLAKRPEHGLLAMRVIAIWGTTDQILFELVSQFLRADFEIVTDMLQALTGMEGRRAAIAAAAKSALSAEDFNLFCAVLKVTKPSRKRRNDFAHHVWGYLLNPNDAVLLADPSALARHAAAKRAKLAGLRGREAVILDTAKIWRFRKRDLEEEVTAALNACHLIGRLHGALYGGPLAVQVRTALSLEPQVQQALQRTTI